MTLTWQEPTLKENDTSKWKTWETTCGTYRVVKVIPAHPSMDGGFATEIKRGETGWDILDSTRQGKTYARYHGSLERAVASVEKHAAGLANDNDAEYEKDTSNPNSPQETIMKVAYAELKGLFHEMGMHQVDGWDAAVLDSRILKLPKYDVPEEHKPQTEALRKLYDDILATLAEKGTVEVTGGPGSKGKKDKTQPPAKEGKGKAKAKAEKANPDKKEGKPKKEPKVKVENNGTAKGRRNGVFLADWGPREGGEARNVLEFFKKPNTVEKAAEKFGITEGKVKLHLRFWKDKGAPVEEQADDKFILKV